MILSAGGGPVPKFKRLKTMDPGTKDNGKRPPVTIEVHFASMKNQDLGVPISAVDRVLCRPKSLNGKPKKEPPPRAE